MTENPLWTISFGGLSVEVECLAPTMVDDLDFLLRDTRDLGGEVQTRFVVKSSQDGEAIEIWRKDQRKYKNKNNGSIATYLAGEIIYHLIDKNSSELVLHAGCVEKNGRAILIPGVSGAGKSSLCSWLTRRGYHYLTDELVSVCPGKSEIEAFTRPLNIKTNGLEVVLNSVLDKDNPPDMLTGTISTLISHRCFNPDYQFSLPKPAMVVFPRYSSSADYELNELTPAKTALLLMQVFVNARNFSEHGFQLITGFARQVKGVELNYSNFNQLDELENMINSLT
ncbi:MAG: hypothetical protein ACI8P9_001786 [Parasphingorhabdus sp.]